MSSETVETVYGRMPAHLSCAKLQDLCVDAGIQTGPFGSQLHQEDYVPKGTPIITVEHLGENRISHSNLPLVSDEDKARLSKYVLRTGDIVFSRVGSVDRRALVQPTEDGWLFSGRCLRVRVDTTLLDARWLSYFFGLPSFKNYIRGIAVGATMPSINTKILSDIPIYFPDLATQREAALTLAQVDDRITLLRETNKTLEAIAQALFKSWFVDFDPVRAKIDGRQPEGMDEATAALFPDSFEESELGLVPKGWSDATLSTVATFQNGYAFKSSDWSEVGHPVVKIGNVKPLQIDFDGCSYVSPQTVVGLERFKLSAGDLLVGMTGYVGEAGLVPHSDTTSYLNQRVGRIMTKNGLRDLGFVFSAVRQKEFKNFAVSQSHGSAQANVSGADLMKFPVTVPSTDVLEKYNEITYQFIASILNNHSEATLLTSLRDTLLPRLISGQLHIADAETELEKALA